MSWIYRQSTGELTNPGLPNGISAWKCVGYAGRYPGLNNPAMQDVQDVGPLPQGTYRMADLIDSSRTGLSTIILVADPGNEMFGRSGFRIHGDNPQHNHTASDGCIVAGIAVTRKAIWESGDRTLEVIE